ncbi:MAG TPA: DUF5655 domain-containing protein [archaeon]|nr:DUF5655 domain-containing protein [archaeon]
MSDIKLFRIDKNQVSELAGRSVAVEKSLQDQIEKYMDTFLGVTFLVSEYSTGKVHGGRIDTLGIDENGCPVIIEYKRATNQNVINQGLFYLDWLLDHRGDYELLVLEKCGKEVSKKIDWSSPRLICIAGDFTKYDQYAVQQINRNIELIRYGRFGEDLLLFELVNAVSADTGSGEYKTIEQTLEEAPRDLADIFFALKEMLLNFGDDVQMKTLKYYFAFKKIKNFACVEIYNKAKKLEVYVKVDPENTKLEKGFSKDVREIGHLGTGNLQITILSMDDLEKARPLLEQSYERS